MKGRPDLVQVLRAGPAGGPLRPVEVEDFGFTCSVNGRPYTGFACASSQGHAMRAGWRLTHFSILAPSEEFEAALPTLAAILGSYELNGETTRGCGA